MSQNALAHAGAQPSRPTHYTDLWTAEFFTGLYTNRSIFLDGGSRIERLYLGPRGDALTAESLNTEVSSKLTIIRRPGSSVYNNNVWNAPDSFYSFKLFGQANNVESIKVLVDQSDAIYDATNGQKLNIWNKVAGSGQSYFQSVADILYFGDGAENKKWIQSRSSWLPDSIYSDTYPGAGTLTDFIVDPNGNLQVAVGGFSLIVNEVQVQSDVLMLTLDTAQIANPSGTPTGAPNIVGGSLAAGNWYAVIVGVDALGNTTQGGTESAAVATTGTTGSIVWSWTPISGVSSYRIYIGTTSGGENTYFTQTQQFYTSTPTFVQTDATGTAGAPPTGNTTVVNVPTNLYRMIGVKLQLSEFTNATFLNGQTITITSVLPGGQYSNQITAAFTHGNYGPASDEGLALSGTGISGATQPSWSTVLNAVTQDGVIIGNLGAQWINRGYAVENWGLAAPVDAPSVFQTPVGSAYQQWAGNTFYWPSQFALVTVSTVVYLMEITTGGVINVVLPSWNTTTGVTTNDGSSVWTCQGPAAWIATHAYGSGVYTSFTDPVTNLSYVYVSLNAGTSGSSQTAWTAAEAPGQTIIDGGITWKCLGRALTYTYAWPGVFADIISSSTAYIMQLTTAGAIGATPPGSWNTTTGATTNDGSAVWTCLGPFLWTATTSYSAGAYVGYVGPGNSGYLFVALNSGTSGSTRAWNGALVNGDTVVDGSITWQCVGPIYIYGTGHMIGSFTAPSDPRITGFGPALADVGTIVDSNGYLEQVQDPGGYTTTLPPTWSALLGSIAQSKQIASIYGANAVPGVAQIGAYQNFTIGNQVTVAGATTTPALNGTWSLLTPGGINFIYFGSTIPTYTFAAETGTVTSLYGATWINIGAYDPAGTGAKQYGYAYLNSIDDTVSDMSPMSPAALLGQGNQNTIEGLGSPDLQCDTVIIYATDQGGATFFQLDTIRNPGPALSWSYVDTLGDAGLNILIEAATDFQNQIPPYGIVNLAYHLNRIFGSVGNTVYWSTGPDTPTGNGLNGFSPSNYAIFPSAVTRLVPLATALFVFTVSDIYLLYGSATTNSPLTPYPYALGYGLSNYNALTVNGGVVYFYTTDSQIMSQDPNNGLSEVGFPIGDQFLSSPWSPSTAYLTWHIGGTRDKALFVADGQGDWFRMCATPAPEQGLTWSPKATITGGAKCIQSVETAPGVHQLLIGPSGPGPILFRDWNTYADNEQPYKAYFTIGSLVLAHPGQVAELAYFTFDSVKVGKPLVPSVRVDEIGGPFEEMPRFTNDPPQLIPSRTLFSNRHYFSQTELPAICRHMQLKISWEVEDEPNEILSSTLYGGYSQEK